MEAARRIELDPKRYRQIRDFAGRVLLKYTEGLLPVRPLEVLKSSSICNVVRYSDFERDVLRSDGLTAGEYFPPDACTQYSPVKQSYVVFYNSEVLYGNGHWRLRWTLAHEIGHIVLGHLQTSHGTCIFGEGLSEEEYAVFEFEANYFAGHLLAYPSVMRACRIQGAHDIKRMCWISGAAAKARYNSLQTSNQLPSKIDAMVAQHFCRVIERRNLPYTPEPDWELYPW